MVSIDLSKILYIPGTRELCDVFGLNPLGTISSGTLIAAIDQDQVVDAIAFLKENGIDAAKIGDLTENPEEFTRFSENGTLSPLEFSETDEITKIFKI